MAPLPTDLRKSLDKSVVAARDASEAACRAALAALGVEAREAPPALSDEQRQLRVALRARQRQLAGEFEQLVAECAYEQWHLMLFARFLAENGLLIHPEHRAAVSLDEVAELAAEEGEVDPWLLAARYAAAMLPGIFKPADPCVRLPLAPEGRRGLEDILAALPVEVFTADDGLGWVYQFWQTKKKKEVNDSDRKIGGADLPPVTQLFTEHYMVRFLLENSLGAWWAARHPESPLLAEWEFLRCAEDGTPAAGRFERWPERVAEVTMMDPCCGSGHFLVAAFEMLRKMRGEEEGLTPREAVDAVLAENLYGLELDARCVQLGAFNLALAAWKAAGYHELPPLNLACSGIPTRGSLEEWTKLAQGDERLELALARLHELFREADTLGSLIDPRRAVEDGTLMSLPFEEVAPLLEQALANDPNPVAAVFGDGAREVAKAAALLAGSYTLVATNPPFLARGKQAESLRKYCERHHSDFQVDLALAFVDRTMRQSSLDGLVVLVTPGKWRYSGSFERCRRNLLRDWRLLAIADLGSKSFRAMLWEFNVVLLMLTGSPAGDEDRYVFIDADCADADLAASELRKGHLGCIRQFDHLGLPGLRVMNVTGGKPLLSSVAVAHHGLTSGDLPRMSRKFWEVSKESGWIVYQGTVNCTVPFGGLENVLRWCDGNYPLAELPGARLDGRGAWGHEGILISQMGSLPVTRYLGSAFDVNTAVLVVQDPEYLPAVWV